MVFIDANPFVYAATDDPRRKPCLELLGVVATGRLEARTAVNVIEKLWHIELRGRPRIRPGVTRRIYELFTPLLPITDDILRAALSIDAPKLGSNDRVIVALCRAAGIQTIISNDHGFDGVPGLQRIDPLDANAVAQLVRV
ncbi:MAG: type II toxin-antitoxin system VapC family toxin [Egibacteraceae bacterium]